MRRATAYAVAVLAGYRRDGNIVDFDLTWALACDWSKRSNDSANLFWGHQADELMSGHRVKLPDCPTCAAFIDLALSIRAEESQERINAELDAERRKTA